MRVSVYARDGAYALCIMMMAYWRWWINPDPLHVSLQGVFVLLGVFW